MQIPVKDLDICFDFLKKAPVQQQLNIIVELLKLGLPIKQFPTAILLLGDGVHMSKVTFGIQLIDAGVQQQKVVAVAGYDGMEILLQLINLGFEDQQIDYSKFERIVRLKPNDEQITSYWMKKYLTDQINYVSLSRDEA